MAELGLIVQQEPEANISSPLSAEETLDAIKQKPSAIRHVP